MSAPEYVFNGHWSIDQEGKISGATYREWDDGDLFPARSYIIGGLIDYYMYSGDPGRLHPELR